MYGYGCQIGLGDVVGDRHSCDQVADGFAVLAGFFAVRQGIAEIRDAPAVGFHNLGVEHDGRRSIQLGQFRFGAAQVCLTLLEAVADGGDVRQTLSDGIHETGCFGLGIADRDGELLAPLIGSAGDAGALLMIFLHDQREHFW